MSFNSFDSDMDVLVNGIIRQSRSQGIKMDEFIASRNKAKQLVLRGYGLTVFNRVMQPGDYFLRNGCPHIALGFYREAIFLFPGNAICHIREGQSLIAMGDFDEAEMACEEAIRLSGGRVYSDLLSLLETFIKCDRLHEALNLYSTLMNKYPQLRFVRKKIKEIKKKLRNREKQNNSKGPEEIVDEATKLRLREEKEARKRKEREERVEMARKREEEEARERKERKEQEEVLKLLKEAEECKIKERKEIELSRKREEKESQRRKVREETKKDQLSFALSEMPTDCDEILSTGSCLRRVCPSCNIPLLFKERSCNSCKNTLTSIWYKNVDIDSWKNPRKPPKCVPLSQPYLQCENFVKGKKCLKSPCTFAHGQDELEIWQLCRSIDVLDIDEASLNSVGPSTSSVSPHMDASTGECSYQSDMTRRDTPVVQTDQRCYRNKDVEEPQYSPSEKKLFGKSKGKNRKSNTASSESTANRQQEQLQCNVCDALFSCLSRLQCHSDTKHRVGTEKKTQLTKFQPHQKEPLLTDYSFGEKVRRRIIKEGARDVLTKDIPGVLVKCSAPLLDVELDGAVSPQTQVWVFHVGIKTERHLSLKQVAFLWQTHLDKFTFLQNSIQDCSPNMDCIEFVEQDFVKAAEKQELVVQFRIQFSSSVFGDFKQKIVFDFGQDLILVRSLFVSVISKNICSSIEDLPSRTRYCCILEWSEEMMELVPYKDLLGMDLDLCDQYSIPDVLPDPSECAEFTRETYCQHWHDILFIEEEYIQREIARYDIQDGEMKIINNFRNVKGETVYAQAGEVYGEIYLSDYLVLDEVAGNLISRSVMSIILRPKWERSGNNRVYECSIKTKTSGFVIIKLNEVLCNDYVFETDKVVYIDVKFRYNGLLMCAMHQAIDFCERKTGVLPSLKNVSCKHKKSIPDWFMDRKPNTNQRDAIAMILDPSPTPPILVIGPFGTGKTFTLNLACVSILSQFEASNILICTHSNSAANIHLEHLDRKMQKNPSLDIRPLRVLSVNRIVEDVPKTLRKYCLIEGNGSRKKFRKPTCNDVCEHNVIITTLATARMLWKFYQDGRLRFTHILIDEAAQALEPECVIPLVMADKNTKIVLAGDHKQMSPPAYSARLWPEDIGPKKSLLERLFIHYKQCNEITNTPSPFSDEDKSSFLPTPHVVWLKENYRCHAAILQFSSDCFYGGELIAMGDQRTHDFKPVLSFHTAQGEDRQVEGGLAYYNIAEVAEVVKQVEYLNDTWPSDWGEKDIGVLAPYRDQVKQIRKSLRKRNLAYVAVETVENAQGKEFRALFISTVRTMWTCSPIERRNEELNSDHSELDFGFLSNPRLLNTAMTRAQSLLAVVGDPMSLCSVGTNDCKNVWKEYLHRCHTSNGFYGCTLKIVMDFCLSSQVLNPSAHEFIPGRTEEDDQKLLNTSFQATANEEEDTDKDDSIADQSAVDNFFRGNGVTENFDKIIVELIKFCCATKENDERPQQISTCNLCQSFFVGLSDGKIDLGFHILPSERLFRLMGGKAPLLDNGDNQLDNHETEKKELLNMVEKNPNLFIKCTLRVDTSGRQWKYYGQLPSRDSPDIQILGRVRGAYEDDIIVLKLDEITLVNKERKEKKIITSGQMQGVLRRSHIRPDRRQFVCTVDPNNPCMMIPRNKSSPKLENKTETNNNNNNNIPIYSIKKNDQDTVDMLTGKRYREALVGERVFVVKYTKWSPNFHFPLGRAIRHMPQGKDFKTGMNILYEDCNIRRRFSKKLNADVAAKFDKDWKIPKIERGRDTYRSHVFTVDPPGSQDLDDAISVASLGNGNYKLHVHIADVSYFVQQDTELDEEARLRGTSYYPPGPEENVPMLPRELSERCCSLLPEKDRLAVTVSVKVTYDGTVVEDPVINRSVVCSSARLTYREAQQIIDETRQQEFPFRDEERQIPVNQAIGVVHRIAQGHRRSRLGVQRSLSHRKGNYDGDGQHQHHYDDNEREAHQMIEEVMIMTNCLVARFLLNRFPECTPLRVQPSPKMRHMVEWRDKFLKFLYFSIGLQWWEEEDVAQQTIELQVPRETWRMIIDSLDQDSDYEQLVRLVCDVDLFPQLSLANSRQQQLPQRARYICSGETFQNIPSLTSSPASDEEDDQRPQNVQNQQKFYEHWGLRLDCYCHFTSPIRRYIDIIVHRLVVAAPYGQQNIDPNDITEICDYCTFISRNCSRFNKEAKNLQVAVNLQGTTRFVSAYIEEVTRDALTLFFGTGEFEHFPSTPVPIGRLRPEKDPDKVVDSVELQWTFRVLRLDKHSRAQPKLDISDYEMMALDVKLKRQKDYTNTTSSDNDFDFTVNGDLWNKVLEAIRNENEDELKSSLQEVDEDIKKRGKPKSSIKVRQKRQRDPKLSSRKPCGHSDAEKREVATEAESDEFLEISRSFKPYDRVKVQMCSRVDKAVLSPSVQLFEIANEIFACVEHRSFPTTCFANTKLERPKDIKIGDIQTYVNVWKPVLMMEIVTSAVNEGDVVILSNLLVGFTQDSQGSVTMEFNLSANYCKSHFLTPLNLNLLCVRVKDPEGSGEDNGYWIGHFQISRVGGSVDANDPTSGISNSKKYPLIIAKLISPSSVPDSIIKQRYCYITAEMIFISNPNRRCYDALNGSITASELIQSICIGEIVERELPRNLSPADFYPLNNFQREAVEKALSTSFTPIQGPPERELPRNLSLADFYPLNNFQREAVEKALSTSFTPIQGPPERELPRNLSLADFYPLNNFQREAVEKALSTSFTPIQGPPGTGKTVTGVHIAYWFAQLNKSKKKDGATSKGSMVFFCGPSNKSVDVVARFLKKIPDLKILRIYGQEVERKVFPIPDQLTQFRSKRVSAQLKADDELQDVSLHHVVRSAECTFAEKLKEYDEIFRTWPENDCGRCAKELREKVKDFNKIKSKAEKWAITQNGVEVVLLTCTAAYGPRIVGVCDDRVSQCIIDECGMCIEAETLCAMLGSKAKQVVLIGDHKQLQPIIKCKKARDFGLGISMFERLYDKCENAQMLKRQYRMHKNLCEFPSVNFYEDKLKTADEVLRREPDNVTWPNGDNYPFAFHHVEGEEEALVVTTEQGNQNSKKNKKEIKKVVDLARSLTHQSIKVQDIVILSPYRAQCFEITQSLETVGLGEISVMSVVESQGSERNYVILSLVRSLPLREIEEEPLRSWMSEHLGFVADEHQINVALTRAKLGLCIVGNANLLGVCKVWKALLNHYKQKGCFVEEV